MSDLRRAVEALAEKWEMDESEDSSNPIGHTAARELRALLATPEPSRETLREKVESCARCDDEIHDWFELSYAQFLTIPRLVMQSMPREWQKKMVALLEEMDDTFDWRPGAGRYWVRLRDADGKFCDAPLDDYRHGSIEHLRRCPRRKG
jgi:hypothetical protein